MQMHAISRVHYNAVANLGARSTVLVSHAFVCTTHVSHAFVQPRGVWWNALVWLIDSVKAEAVQHPPTLWPPKF